MSRRIRGTDSRLMVEKDWGRRLKWTVIVSVCGDLFTCLRKMFYNYKRVIVAWLCENNKNH